ncbi:MULTISPECIES: cysteine hydrolase family protein [Thermomicrobium]|jgi:nicotinamidase-related amidase|uniref:Isochorismatase hydrolase n=1 Tax=Thermomicrobium roseum (strain ATCC 27502 / DSM 5159 / P-2) TaxID=309801 RepID=B9L428_THERP|nr:MULTISPECIES: isochorismatase family cysteine hydrolase [Thermomicrobium]ACM06587.1 isochorismatase hydrolase [Thermomicrobium roseum DSM 5159]MBO9306905.1 cysteine hydrolase [Thermomicrobium sp.]MBO9405403.1 cysteine hydrolase [Thermomicrobium sp.]
MPRTVEVPEYTIAPEVEIDPRTTALIVVDMQNDFVRPEGKLFVPDAPATVPKIQALLAFARQHGIFTVFTQDTHYPGDPEFPIWGEHCVAGTWGWQIIDELAPREGELVLQKRRYDAFYGTPLDHELRLRKIEQLIICGTVASICVHYTAASAALRWYGVIIPVDATSALHPFDLEAANRQTAFLFRGVLTRADGVRLRSGVPA